MTKKAKKSVKNIAKIFVTICAAVMCLAVAFGLTACGNDLNGEKDESDRTLNGQTINFYAPDGAPALAVAQLMYENNQFGGTINYNIVTSNAITAQVSGNNPAADVCVLPVTAASKLLGSGQTYKMLGTVTHGNIYIVSVNGDEITSSNAAEKLVGKTVGVVNLAAFPGQMFKLAMSKLNISVNDTENFDANAVNVKGLSDGTSVGGATNNYDYYVIAEQAASARVKATAQTPNPVTIKGSLQELYGVDGYPQAVLVAKTSLIEQNPEFIAELQSAMTKAANWLSQDTTTIEQITTAISAHLPAGTDATLNTKNLTKDVITRCSVNFVKSADCKEEVKTFLSEMASCVSGAAVTVDDAFFYLG
jgi:ABC-type nitrate/sulfonate/bicarbonate transport system substrate-binding protein